MPSDFYTRHHGLDHIIAHAINQELSTSNTLTESIQRIADTGLQYYPQMSPQDTQQLYTEVADEIVRRRQYQLSANTLGSLPDASWQFVSRQEEPEPSSLSGGVVTHHYASAWDFAFNWALTQFDQGHDRAAAMIFHECVKLGYVEAGYMLGLIYQRNGQIILAKDYYQQAAEQGSQNARFNLGALYAEAQEYENAIQCLLPLALDGQDDAEVELGTVYAHCEMFAEAEFWLLKGEQKGNAIAVDNLRSLYFNVGLKLGQAKQYKASIDWLQKAAIRGSSDAQYLLSHSYAMAATEQG